MKMRGIITATDAGDARQNPVDRAWLNKLKPLDDSGKPLYGF
jgi:hypothetical protein